MIRVFVVGEGVHDIGRWAHGPYADRYGDGVVQALLKRCATAEFEVVGGAKWDKVRSVSVGGGLHGRETRKVRQMVLLADKAGADVLAMLRDEDGDPDREAQADRGVVNDLNIQVVHGLAVRTGDAWCLAMLGERGSEGQRHPKERLGKEHGVASTEDRVHVVAHADLDHLPDDATSLRRWIERARAALSPRS